MVLIADVGSSWSEGFGARNIVIRNNSFDSSNCIGAGDGAAISIGAASNESPTYYPFLIDFLFEGNVFKETTGPVIEASAFQQLIFRGNRIVNMEKVSSIEKDEGGY